MSTITDPSGSDHPDDPETPAYAPATGVVPPADATWPIVPPFTDTDLGILRSGKEAQVDLVERRSVDDPDLVALVARKRYLPRHVTHKGQLEAMGVTRASTFRNDATYREGRQFRRSRERRAVERMSRYGKRLLQQRWTGHECEVMGTLWAAGLAVPRPISYGDDVFDMEYLGERDGAAPHLDAARLDEEQLADAFAQLVDGLTTMTAAGWVHGDLSAYNMLWWRDRLWFIDFPQALDLAANPQGLNFLHRDVVNVCEWFERRGLRIDGSPPDPEEVFAELLVVV